MSDENIFEVGTALRYNEGKIRWGLNFAHQMNMVLAADRSVSFSASSVLLSVNHFQAQQNILAVAELIYAIQEYAKVMGIDSWNLMEQTTRVWEYGATKYKAWNWVSGHSYTEVLSSMLRHLERIERFEEDYDAESGFHHVGHMLCNAFMLHHFVHHYPELNDLPPAEAFAAPKETG